MVACAECMKMDGSLLITFKISRCIAGGAELYNLKEMSRTARYVSSLFLG